METTYSSEGRFIDFAKMVSYVKPGFTWFYLVYELPRVKRISGIVFKPVLRVHKDRHDSKLVQIVFYTCYVVYGPRNGKFKQIRVI